jgi:hypothetical protein
MPWGAAEQQSFNRLLCATVIKNTGGSTICTPRLPVNFDNPPSD